MSPQQVKGQVLDRRSDIYSLGVSLFQMLTGQARYDEESSEYDLYQALSMNLFPTRVKFYVRGLFLGRIIGKKIYSGKKGLLGPKRFPF